MTGSERALVFAEGAIFARDYRIIRPLSEGGMGAIYVVEQLSTGRERALKVMHPEIVRDAALRRRFEQEARIGAGIESDHILEVLAAGVDDPSGIPWIVMELLKGEDLAAMLRRRGCVDLQEFSTIFEQVCHGIGAAHVRGVVHRDLKPENIFLSSTRRTGMAVMVKVLDFGIAKFVEEGRGSTTAAIGTPLWMAPEQTEAGRPISPATDVWALGLIAFRLICGHSYWLGASAESASPIMLLREVVLDPIVLASERAAQLKVPERLPVGFDAWFAKCVAREPAQRFLSALEAWEALAPILPAPMAGAGPAGAFSARTGALALEQEALARTVAVLEEEEEVPKGPPTRVRMWIPIAVLSGGLIVAGAVVGVRAVINAAEHAAAKVVASAEQQRHKEIDAEKKAEIQKKIQTKRGEFDVLVGRMIRLPAGLASIGSAGDEVNESPVHPVQFAAFEIDESEVSVASWQKCMGQGKCDAPAVNGQCNFGRPERRNHPVNCVTWNQAKAFCEWAVKRLPTEEEWEYASRGVEGRLYPWGGNPPSDQLCWRRDGVAKQEGTCQSAEHMGGNTPLGLRDLAGNVQEWTSSNYCPYSRKTCEARSKVLRGSSWVDTEATSVRASARNHAAPDSQGPSIGFRCVRDGIQ